MDKLDISKLVDRIENVYRRQLRDTDTLGRIANEWQQIIGFASAKRMNDALTIYMRDNRVPPTPAHLLTIYKDLERQTNKGTLYTENKCPMCGGGRYALVEVSWMYHTLGLPCPCKNPGELLALQNGLKVLRKVGKRGSNGRVWYVGEVELWMQDGRLYGEVKRGFGLEKDRVDEQLPEIEQAQSQQGRLFSPEEWATEMELPF